MAVVESGRATMHAYLDALVARGDFARYFAEDVEFKLMGTDQEVHGRAAVEQAIRGLHEQVFDARPEVKSLVCDDMHAGLEADFVGRHVLEFAGKAPKGKEVRAPYAVIYDLDGGQIKALRIYGFMEALLPQLE